MVLMLHHDAVVAPDDNQIVRRKGERFIHNLSAHESYLEARDYEDFSVEELNSVSNTLKCRCL
jgi:hypothetical protein